MRLGLKLEVCLLEITGKSLPNKVECLSPGEKGQLPQELRAPSGWSHTCRPPKGCAVAEGGEKGGAGLLEPEGPIIYYFLHSGQAQRP